MVDAGPGLKLIHCDGPLSASNAAAKFRTKKAFDVTKGSTTCTWKAVSATNAWVNGPNLSVDSGGENIPAGDFYAVIGKGGVIEGHVREQNVKKEASDLAGVAGAKVRITGPRGYVKTTTTSDSGYYHEIVKRSGAYKVTAQASKGYFKGQKGSEPDPPSQAVGVTEESTSEADFTFKSTLKLKLKLSKSSVPANGLAYVDVTVTATDGGQPDEDLAFSLRPYGGGRASQSPFEMPVPATICKVTGSAVGSRVWPDPGLTVPNTDSVTVTTDSSGTATLRVYTGTVSGKFPLTVWALDDAGHLITKDVSNVSDEADIDVTSMSSSGDPADTLHDWLNKPGNEALANTLPTDNASIAIALEDAVKSGRLRPFVVTPVLSKGYSAVLLSPSGSRLTFDPKNGQIASSSPGEVVTPNGLINTGYAGGFWGYLKTTAAPAEFPTLTQWLNNSAPGYSFTQNGGPVTTGTNALQYDGFGYGPNWT